MTYLPSWATLKLYRPNGTLFKDLSGDDSLALEYTDTCPGGFSDASFTLCNYYGRTPDFGYTAVIKDENENVELFRGLTQNPSFDVGNNVSIRCIGHGNSEGSCSFLRDWGDGNQTPTDGRQVYARSTPVIDIWRDTLTHCQQIFEGTLNDLSGIQLSQESRDFQGQAPYDMWQELSNQLVGLATPLLWFVRESAGLPSIYTRFADYAVRLRCTWDNDTVKIKDTYDQNSVINQATIKYGNGRRRFNPDPGPRSHTILPTNNDRDKFVDLNNELRDDTDALALAGNYMARFNVRRPISGSIELCGAAVTALPPIVDSGLYPTGRTKYPLQLIQAGWVIQTQGLPSGQAPFNIEEHFVVAAHYTFDDNKMTLTIGELVNLGSAIKQVNAFATSLGAIATNVASLSVPEYHQAATPIYGPQAAGSTPAQNDNQIGQPVYVLNDTFTDPDAQLSLPFKAGVHPQTIPDYGVQANFGREADSIGVKGFIRVIPCKILNWELCFTPPPGSTTVPTQDITIKLWDNYPTSGANLIDTLTITDKQCDSGTLALGAHNTFAQGGKIGVEVTAVGGSNVTNSGFIIGVGGKKLYPDLGVTS